jgi:hypothetical protein
VLQFSGGFDYSIIGFGYRTHMGLKENPEFDFNGF